MAMAHQLARLESLAGIYLPAAPLDPTAECLRLIANFAHERRDMMSEETEQFLADLTAALMMSREEQVTRRDLLGTIEAETESAKQRVGEDIDEASIEAKRLIGEAADALDRRMTKITKETVLAAAVEAAESAVSKMADDMRSAMLDRLDNLAGDLKERVAK